VSGVFLDAGGPLTAGLLPAISCREGSKARLPDERRKGAENRRE